MFTLLLCFLSLSVLRLSSALSIRVHTPPCLNNCPHSDTHTHTYTHLTTWVPLLAEQANISLVSGSKHEARSEKTPLPAPSGACLTATAIPQMWVLQHKFITRCALDSCSPNSSGTEQNRRARNVSLYADDTAAFKGCLLAFLEPLIAGWAQSPGLSKCF